MKAFQNIPKVGECGIGRLVVIGGADLEEGLVQTCCGYRPKYTAVKIGAARERGRVADNGLSSRVAAQKVPEDADCRRSRKSGE